jgi:hypothetical protein
VRGVTEPAARVLASHVFKAYSGPAFGGVSVIFADDPARVAIILGDCSDPWKASMGIATRLVLSGIVQAVDLLNAGREAGGTRVDIAPWWAVEDILDIEWGTWPSGERDRLEQAVFPTLPNWCGSAAAPQWLGPGVTFEAGQLTGVGAVLRWQFKPHRGIVLSGAGPGGELDSWFAAAAHATRLFPIETYSPLAAGPKPAHQAKA